MFLLCFGGDKTNQEDENKEYLEEQIDKQDQESSKKPKIPAEQMTFEQWRNNINYPKTQQIWNSRIQKKYLESGPIRKVLQMFQYHTVMFMSGVQQKVVPRGLLLYFQMGTGKTITAIASALYAIHTLPQYGLIAKPEGHQIDKKTTKITLFVSKMLEINARGQIELYCQLLNENKLSITFEDRQTPYTVSELLSHFQFITGDLDQFDYPITARQFVIIDEAHNFIRQANNNSKYALNLYFKLSKMPNIQLLLLSGTVIANDPTEIALMFQLLSGNSKLFDTNMQQITMTRIEFNSNFKQFFVKEDSVVNKQQFIKRQMGLTSYVDLPLNSTALPKMLPIQYIEVKFNNEAHEAEYKEVARDELKAGDSFMQNSRKLANSVQIGDKVISPKFEHIWEQLRSNKTIKSLLFSSFVDQGLEAFLQYIRQNPRDQVIINVDFKSPTALKPNQFGYIMIAGDTPIDDRKQILAMFNCAENVYGQYCQLMMFSPASAEGVSLFDTRQVFVLEPQWSFSLIKQIIYRAYRMYGHQNLRDDEKTLLPFVYLLGSTDLKIMSKIKQKDKIITELKILLQLGSITCSLYEKMLRQQLQDDKARCFLCKFNDQGSSALFDAQTMYNDIRNHNCQREFQLQSSDTEISFNNIVYKWYADIYSDNSIYIYDTRTMQQVTTSNPLHQHLIELITRKHVSAESVDPIQQEPARELQVTQQDRIIMFREGNAPKQADADTLVLDMQSKQYSVLQISNITAVIDVFGVDYGSCKLNHLLFYIAAPKGSSQDEIISLITQKKQEKGVQQLILLEDEMAVYGKRTYYKHNVVENLLADLYVQGIRSQHNQLYQQLQQQYSNGQITVYMRKKTTTEIYLIQALLRSLGGK